MGIRCADHVTPLYPQKLALTSPTGGGRSVGIIRSRTKATESYCFINESDQKVGQFLTMNGSVLENEYMKKMTSVRCGKLYPTAQNFLLLFILFSPTQDAPNSQTPVRAQFIGLHLNGKPKDIKFRILKFSYQLTEAQSNGARSPRFDYHTTSGAFLLCPRKDVPSPSSQRHRDTKGKHEDKCDVHRSVHRNIFL